MKEHVLLVQDDYVLLVHEKLPLVQKQALLVYNRNPLLVHEDNHLFQGENLPLAQEENLLLICKRRKLSLYTKNTKNIQIWRKSGFLNTCPENCDTIALWSNEFNFIKAG